MRIFEQEVVFMSKLSAISYWFKLLTCTSDIKCTYKTILNKDNIKLRNQLITIDSNT
jgi:hypothetical protein